MCGWRSLEGRRRDLYRHARLQVGDASIQIVEEGAVESAGVWRWAFLLSASAKRCFSSPLPGLIHSASMHGTSPENRDGAYSGPKVLTAFDPPATLERPLIGKAPRRPSASQEDGRRRAPGVRSRMMMDRRVHPQSRASPLNAVNASPNLSGTSRGPRSSSAAASLPIHPHPPDRRSPSGQRRGWKVMLSIRFHPVS